MSSYINFKNCGQMAANSPLTQQSSIYALTFDELQTTLGGSGKDFGSMNMDELLKNIWTAEETQSLTSNSNFDINGGIADNANLQRQGSLTLPRTLSQKTVDEVWKELHKENGGHSHGGFKDMNLIKDANLQPQQKQPALGEMTLEAFLQKAGVVSEKPQVLSNGRQQNEGLFGNDGNGFGFGFKNPNQNKRFHQETESKNEMDNLQGVRSSQQPKPSRLFPKQAAFNFGSSHVNNGQMGNLVNGVSVIGKSDHLIKTSMVQAKGVGGLMARSPPDTSPSPPPSAYGYGEGGVQERKRGGPLEKVVERRRKRMIKNRESAARSRARKQMVCTCRYYKYSVTIHPVCTCEYCPDSNLVANMRTKERATRVPFCLNDEGHLERIMKAYTLELEAEVAKLKELNHELQKKQEEIMESQNFQVPEKMKLWGSKGLCLRRTLTGPW